jgi:3-hydroxy-3-methylglutaryl CoA synthase
MIAGIEALNVYPCTFSLEMKRLCEARGHDVANIRDTMMIDERSVNAPWEDPVTMAVNAALPLVTDENRAKIELVIVASESGVDHEKPMSTWVQRYLGLTPNVRNFELKHACYGATAGMRMALGWVASGMARGGKALVISTDQSRMHLGKPWEFVMGAGATAMIISDQPDVLEVELHKSGVHTDEVSDLTRPTSRVETGNSETSLLSYLDALEGAYTNFLDRLREPIDFDAYFAKNIYHAPFGGMTLRAHRALLRRWKKLDKDATLAHFAAKSLPALTHLRRMGGTYGSSTFIGLIGMLETATDLAAGDRVSMFSYGSGSCAEFYSALVGPRGVELARAMELGAKLSARRALTVREYEDIERERTCWIDQGDFAPSKVGFDDWYERRYRGQHLLVFQGIEDHYRKYGWS